MLRYEVSLKMIYHVRCKTYMGRDPGRSWRVIRLILHILETLETRSRLSHSALTVDLMLKSHDVTYSLGETDGVRLEYAIYR